MEGRPRLAIVGAGFAGLAAIRTLAKEPVDVILIDRNNYHTFSPLLYQIGAAELESAEIAYPLRKYLRQYPNVQFLMEAVERIDPTNKVLECRNQTVSYDYLILASGSVPFYFGVSGAERYALPLKTVEDGVGMRNHILNCFEEAVYESDAGERRRWLTFTVVGGGPSGVEFVCALAELINGPISRDYPRLDMSEVSLVLVEAEETVLAAMPPELRDYAARRLAKKGVEVRSGSVVNEISHDSAQLKSGEVISTRTVIWTAGVQAGHLARSSGVEVNEKNQVKVGPTLEVPGSPGFYATGDAAVVSGYENPLPMVAPVATQQGETAARNVLRQISGLEARPFRYRDRGTLAVLGRNSAVGQVGKFKLSGFTAWLIWAGVHISGIIGFRNRLQVMINWTSAYVFSERPIRLIIPSNAGDPSPQEKTRLSKRAAARGRGGESPEIRR